MEPARRPRVTKPNKGPRPAAKNGSAPDENGALKVDLQPQDLEVLVKACKGYRASLPSYLASAQEDYTRAQTLIEKLGELIAAGGDG